MEALGVPEDELVRALLGGEHAEAGTRPDGGDGHRTPEPGPLPDAPRVLAGVEQRAAWDLYVELVTRTAVADLGPDSGLLREALDSLYSLFGTARAILRRYGPALALVNGDGTFVHLTTTILNDVLRPMLSKWHPLLLDHESRRPVGASAVEHERSWTRNDELRHVLAEARATLAVYAGQLGQLAAAKPTDR